MRRIAIASVGGVLMLAVLAQTASAKIIVIDREKARGEFQYAQAAGAVDDPKRIWVKVKSRPRQEADGVWNMHCEKGYGSGATDGHHSGSTPYRRRLRMPYRRPDSCNVVANAQLSDSGLIIVVLLARV